MAEQARSQAQLRDNGFCQPNLPLRYDQCCSARFPQRTCMLAQFGYFCVEDNVHYSSCRNALARLRLTAHNFRPMKFALLVLASAFTPLFAHAQETPAPTPPPRVYPVALPNYDEE